MRDSLGRRRTRAQNRGLRPLFPRLEADEQSHSIRVAMSGRAWRALDRAIAASKAVTRPRAIGEVLERALGTAPPADWQEWQIRKEKQLLEKAS
ncbi:MAG TPA: hypothetical protein VFA34_08905 [Actinomycetota bacterium]|jgi:hypothetical protein|nr:hypothetical protein [Actinomycetota bacterium]